MPNEPAQTLGQRIDAVLEPLYAEAEQHRATIAQATEQQQALQQQIDAATQGLGQIESRMAEVVRSLAQQEPVIAAVVGETSPAAKDQAQADAVAQAEPEAAQAVAPPATQADESAALASMPPEVTSEELESEVPPIELDPEADAAAVDEASAILDAPPTEPEAASEAAPQPEVDLAAAAERAAAAAKQLREKAANK